MVVVEYNVHFSEFKRHNRSFVYHRWILPLILFFVMDIMMQIFHEQESWAEDSGLSFCSPPPTSHSIPSKEFELMDVFFERVISNMCSWVAVMADCSILQQTCNIF
jgi:hypothetical protein